MNSEKKELKQYKITICKTMTCLIIQEVTGNLKNMFKKMFTLVN